MQARFMCVALRIHLDIVFIAGANNKAEVGRAWPKKCPESGEDST